MNKLVYGIILLKYNESPRIWVTQFAHVHYHPCNRDHAGRILIGLVSRLAANVQVQLAFARQRSFNMKICHYNLKLCEGYIHAVITYDLHSNSEAIKLNQTGGMLKHLRTGSGTIDR